MELLYLVSKRRKRTQQLITVAAREKNIEFSISIPGTFITEWDDGAAHCETFLKDEGSYRSLADKLVHISHYYGFDGWLVNIENVLSVS